MFVEHGPKIGTPCQSTYYGDWRLRPDGHQHRRIIALVVDIVDASAVNPTNVPLLPRRVPQWTITVTDHSTGRLGEPVVVVHQVVSEVRAALGLLRQAMRRAIADGYADARDLERVPAPLD